jgi:hypothetical protein
MAALGQVHLVGRMAALGLDHLVWNLEDLTAALGLDHLVWNLEDLTAALGRVHLVGRMAALGRDHLVWNLEDLTAALGRDHRVGLTAALDLDHLVVRCHHQAKQILLMKGQQEFRAVLLRLLERVLLEHLPPVLVLMVLTNQQALMRVLLRSRPRL